MRAAISPMRATRSTTLEAKDILTPRQLAERLQVKLCWVYESTRARGRFGLRGTPLPVLRVGQYLRFCWPDVVEWLRSNGAK
jgi:hypothetical protein